MKKQKIVVIAAICMVTIFVFGGYFYKSRQANKVGSMGKGEFSSLVREYSQTHGSNDAKVNLVEFFDPACETCGAFYPFVKNMMAANPDKIKLIMRYAPFHNGSEQIVKILEAARKQDKFFETLEVLYRNQSVWASNHTAQPELVWEFLTEVGVNTDQIKNDMNDPEFAKRIAQDIADADALGVKQTPEFFVNGKPLPSFGYEQLAELVESEIRANY